MERLEVGSVHGPDAPLDSSLSPFGIVGGSMFSSPLASRLRVFARHALLVSVLVMVVPWPMQAQELAWITTHGGSIQIINTATTTVIGTIQLPGVALPNSATDIAITPDGKKVYVTTDSPIGTFVLDASTWAVRSTIPVSGYSIAINRDGTRAYIGSKTSPFPFCTTPNNANSVVIVDTLTDTLLPSPSGLDCIAANEINLTPDGSRLYLVGNPLVGPQSLSIFNLSTNSFLPLFAAIQPWGVAITPDGAHAYLTGYGPSTPGILEVDPATNSFGAGLQVPPSSFFPNSVVISPDGGRAYVLDLALGQDGSLGQVAHVIDTATKSIIATVSPATVSEFGYGRLAVTRDGKKVFVTRHFQGQSPIGSMWVIDTGTNTVAASILSDVNMEPTDR